MTGILFLDYRLGFGAASDTSSYRLFLGLLYFGFGLGFYNLGLLFWVLLNLRDLRLCVKLNFCLNDRHHYGIF